MDQESKGPGTPVIPLLLILTLCYGVGFVTSQIATSDVAWWYPTLDRPSYAPPMWAFFPLAAVTYGLMGLAAWVVWRSDSAQRGLALAVFGIQLLLTGIWFSVFFAAHKLPLAVVESLLLLTAVLLAVALFARVRGVAAWLLAPHLVWVCYLAAVSYGIWRLNPYEGMPKTAIPPTVAAPRR